MNSQPSPLQAGSPTARAIHQLMSGQPVVNVGVGRGPDATYDLIAAVLARLAANPQQTPTPRIIIASCIGRAGVRLVLSSHEARLRSRGLHISSAVDGRHLWVQQDPNGRHIQLLFDDVEEPSLQGIAGCDLLIVEPDPHHRMANADRIFPASQILAIEDRMTAAGYTMMRPSRPVTPGMWGEIPLEVILAAEPA